MFTGLVEECAIVKTISKNNNNNKDYVCLRIGIPKISKGMSVGDSVSINGVCLTVVKKNTFLASLFKKKWIEVEMLRTTLTKTSLHTLKMDSHVNVERALSASGRLGGHFVTGHVVCVAKVVSFEQQHKNYFLKVLIPKQYMKYMMKEGSVTLHGISLTIADIDRKKNIIMCNIIPHTREVTTLKYTLAGDFVNVEPDVLAKYVENIHLYQKTRTKNVSFSKQK